MSYSARVATGIIEEIRRDDLAARSCVLRADDSQAENGSDVKGSQFLHYVWNSASSF